MKKISKMRKKALKVKNSSKGVVLITSYMLISTMAIFSLALFSHSTAFVRASERNQNRIVAFNMAESAVDLAIAEITADNSYTGTSYSSLGSQGGYSVTVSTPNDNANIRIITASGFAPDNSTSSWAYESRSNTAYLEISSGSAFEFAVFADQSMTLNGNSTTDSYDSSAGTYDASTAGSNGDIGTNGTSSGSISLSGNTEVNGNASVGVDGDTSTDISISGNAVINGSSSTLSSTKSFSSPTTPAGATDLGDLQVKGNTTYSLASGTYSLDSLSISGNGSLSAIGEIIIYVSGSVSISGNGVETSSSLPPNFLIYVTGSEDVSISGNADLYAGIYAPNSTVTNTGNGDVYGAIVSGTYQQSGNGDLHYDAALNEVAASGGGEVSLKAWAENYTLMAS